MYVWGCCLRPQVCIPPRQSAVRAGRRRHPGSQVCEVVVAPRCPWESPLGSTRMGNCLRSAASEDISLLPETPDPVTDALEVSCDSFYLLFIFFCFYSASPGPLFTCDHQSVVWGTRGGHRAEGTILEDSVVRKCRQYDSLLFNSEWVFLYSVSPVSLFTCAYLSRFEGHVEDLWQKGQYN